MDKIFCSFSSCNNISDTVSNETIIITCRTKSCKCSVKFHRSCWESLKNKIYRGKETTDEAIVGEVCSIPKCMNHMMDDSQCFISTIEVIGINGKHKVHTKEISIQSSSIKKKNKKSINGLKKTYQENENCQDVINSSDDLKKKHLENDLYSGSKKTLKISEEDDSCQNNQGKITCSKEVYNKQIDQENDNTKNHSEDFEETNQEDVIFPENENKSTDLEKAYEENIKMFQILEQETVHSRDVEENNHQKTHEEKSDSQDSKEISNDHQIIKSLNDSKTINQENVISQNTEISSNGFEKISDEINSIGKTENLYRGWRKVKRRKKGSRPMLRVTANQTVLYQSSPIKNEVRIQRKQTYASVVCGKSFETDDNSSLQSNIILNGTIDSLKSDKNKELVNTLKKNEKDELVESSKIDDDEEKVISIDITRKESENIQLNYCIEQLVSEVNRINYENAKLKRELDGKNVVIESLKMKLDKLLREDEKSDQSNNKINEAIQNGNFLKQDHIFSDHKTELKISQQSSIDETGNTLILLNKSLKNQYSDNKILLEGFIDQCEFTSELISKINEFVENSTGFEQFLDNSEWISRRKNLQDISDKRESDYLKLLRYVQPKLKSIDKSDKIDEIILKPLSMKNIRVNNKNLMDMILNAMFILSER